MFIHPCANLDLPAFILDYLLGRAVPVHGASIRASVGQVCALHRHLPAAGDRRLHGGGDGGTPAQDLLQRIPGDGIALAGCILVSGDDGGGGGRY